jgi:hypothetical protein
MLSFRSVDTTKNYLRRISPVAVREPGAVVVAALGAGAVVASA